MSRSLMLAVPLASLPRSSAVLIATSLTRVRVSPSHVPGRMAPGDSPVRPAFLPCHAVPRIPYGPGSADGGAVPARPRPHADRPRGAAHPEQAAEPDGAAE